MPRDVGEGSGHGTGMFHTASAANIARSIKRKRQKNVANPWGSKPRAVKKPRVAKRRPTPTLDRFADLLAANLTVNEASEAMGVPVKRGQKLLAALRKRLGPQAV